jgi:hypothetical protein
MRRACRASVRFGEASVTCPAYVPPAFNTPLPSTSDTVTDPTLARTGGEEVVVLPALLVALGLVVRRAARR